MSRNPKPFVYKQFAKSKRYRDELSKIEKAAHCPFCPAHFKYHKKPILKETKRWLATENSWPYPGTNVHCILIAKRHMERFEELIDADFRDVRMLITWLIRRYKIPGGGLALRFGNPIFTGATVRHLHFQLIQPKLRTKNKVNVVNFPIG